MSQDRITNDLLIVRRNRGLSRKQVASLLGLQGTSTLKRYEQGRLKPSLTTLLRLEILYRTPVAYLYPRLYTALRDEVRSLEEAIRGGSGGEIGGSHA